MYSNLPNLIIGFHGCTKDVFENVLYSHEPLLPSDNDYDWLGNGIYFWEDSLIRAQDWAKSSCERYNKNHPLLPPKEPAVIGAVISLGHCLNLTDYGSADILKKGYEILKIELSSNGKDMPINKNAKNNNDLLLRYLDCAVIERIHHLNSELGYDDYDSVRGIFIEGSPVYPKSGIMEKNHIQICIRNPNCIKGYFKPLIANKRYKIV